MRTPNIRSLEGLVATQVLRWQDEERRRKSARRAPCVALSRLPGSGAAEVGTQVATALGYGFFGIEIVDHIARENRVQRELVADLDERAHAGIERWVSETFRRHAFDENDYLREVVRTLGTLSERGQAVVVGRGSPYVMPAERTLRVLVVAPRAARIERFAKSRELSPSDAERALVREEAERLEFLRRHFRIEPNDASLYDVAVNTGALGIEGAAELVLAAFRTKFGADAAR
jgi:cytidylate kinase